MSYSVTIKITDGTAVVAGQTGTIPDGTISVNGHQDATYTSIGVSRAEPDGNYTVQASGISYPAAFAKAVTS